jgi:hypothetical protein
MALFIDILIDISTHRPCQLTYRICQIANSAKLLLNTNLTTEVYTCGYTATPPLPVTTLSLKYKREYFSIKITVRLF